MKSKIGIALLTKVTKSALPKVLCVLIVACSLVSCSNNQNNGSENLLRPPSTVTPTSVLDGKTTLNNTLEKPITINWKPLYKKKIEAINKEVENDDGICIRFACLTDLDFNGIPELIVWYGDGNAVSDGFEIFDLKNKRVVKVGHSDVDGGTVDINLYKNMNTGKDIYIKTSYSPDVDDPTGQKSLISHSEMLYENFKFQQKFVSANFLNTLQELDYTTLKFEGDFKGAVFGIFNKNSISKLLNSFVPVTSSVLGKVSEVSVSKAPGTYYCKELSVSLKVHTSGASIYFTTDGTTPSKLSTKYSNPIQIKSSCKIEAIAIEDGMASSSTKTFEYVIKPEDYKWKELYYDFISNSAGNFVAGIFDNSKVIIKDFDFNGIPELIICPFDYESSTIGVCFINGKLQQLKGDALDFLGNESLFYSKTLKRNSWISKIGLGDVGFTTEQVQELVVKLPLLNSKEVLKKDGYYDEITSKTVYTNYINGKEVSTGKWQKYYKEYFNTNVKIKNKSELSFTYNGQTESEFIKILNKWSTAKYF